MPLAACAFVAIFMISGEFLRAEDQASTKCQPASLKRGLTK
jgi:hypothetical protein